MKLELDSPGHVQAKEALVTMQRDGGPQFTGGDTEAWPLGRHSGAERTDERVKK